MPGAVLGVEDTVVNKTDKGLLSCSLHSTGEIDNKPNKSQRKGLPWWRSV